MNAIFPCTVCNIPIRIELPTDIEPSCPVCSRILPLADPQCGPELPRCAVCSAHELYAKKDFPQSLGMFILMGGLIGATITYYFYLWWATWSILIGSALLDGFLYLWVKDVVVCYRCNAHFRGVTPNARFAPFELGIFERYRQERLRREELHQAAATNGESPK